MELVMQKDWDYTLYRSGDGLIISVSCGSVGVYELSIALNCEETARHLESESFIGELAAKIRMTPTAYGARVICNEDLQALR